MAVRLRELFDTGSSGGLIQSSRSITAFKDVLKNSLAIASLAASEIPIFKLARPISEPSIHELMRCES